MRFVLISQAGEAEAGACAYSQQMLEATSRLEQRLLGAAPAPAPPSAAASTPRVRPGQGQHVGSAALAAGFGAEARRARPSPLE